MRRKSQKLRSTSERLPETFDVVTISGECRHEHSSSEWETFRQYGSWVYPTSFKGEHAARMVCQAAVALSWDMVLPLGYRMRIPQSPALAHLKNGESQELWLQLPAEAMSWLSMVRIATQLMITPPVCGGHVRIGKVVWQDQLSRALLQRERGRAKQA